MLRLIKERYALISFGLSEIIKLTMLANGPQIGHSEWYDCGEIALAYSRSFSRASLVSTIVSAA